MDLRIQAIIVLVNSTPNRKLSLSEMASRVSLSAPRLRALFKAETGVSLAQYQKRLRMNEAQRLLSTTFLSVKEIMYEVGILDESHFVRDFKKIYGLSPLHYREQHYNVVLINPGATTHNDQIG